MYLPHVTWKRPSLVGPYDLWPDESFSMGGLISATNTSPHSRFHPSQQEPPTLSPHRLRNNDVFLCFLRCVFGFLPHSPSFSELVSPSGVSLPLFHGGLRIHGELYSLLHGSYCLLWCFWGLLGTCLVRLSFCPMALFSRYGLPARKEFRGPCVPFPVTLIGFSFSPPRFVWL